MPSEERSHFLLTYKHCIYICKKRWRKRNLRVTPKLTRNNNRNPSVPQSSKTTNKIITISRNDLQVRLAPQRKLWYSLLCCFCYCLKIKLFILSNSIEKRSFEATAGIWVVLFVMFLFLLICCWCRHNRQLRIFFATNCRSLPKMVFGCIRSSAMLVVVLLKYGQCPGRAVYGGDDKLGKLSMRLGCNRK